MHYFILEFDMLNKCPKKIPPGGIAPIYTLVKLRYIKLLIQKYNVKLSFFSDALKSSIIANDKLYFQFFTNFNLIDPC